MHIDDDCANCLRNKELNVKMICELIILIIASEFHSIIIKFW